MIEGGLCVELAGLVVQCDNLNLVEIDGCKLVTNRMMRLISIFFEPTKGLFRLGRPLLRESFKPSGTLSTQKTGPQYSPDYYSPR